MQRVEVESVRDYMGGELTLGVHEGRPVLFVHNGIHELSRIDLIDLGEKLGELIPLVLERVDEE